MRIDRGQIRFLKYVSTETEPKRDLNIEYDLLPNYEMFSKNIYERFGMPTGMTHPSVHLVPSLLELAYLLLVETNPFAELVAIFQDYAVRSSLRKSLCTFSIFLYTIFEGFFLPRPCVGLTFPFFESFRFG